MPDRGQCRALGRTVREGKAGHWQGGRKQTTFAVER